MSCIFYTLRYRVPHTPPLRGLRTAEPAHSRLPLPPFLAAPMLHAPTFPFKPAWDRDRPPSAPHLTRHTTLLATACSRHHTCRHTARSHRCRTWDHDCQYGTTHPTAPYRARNTRHHTTHLYTPPAPLPGFTAPHTAYRATVLLRVYLLLRVLAYWDTTPHPRDHFHYTHGATIPMPYAHLPAPPLPQPSCTSTPAGTFCFCDTTPHGGLGSTPGRHLQHTTHFWCNGGLTPRTGYCTTPFLQDPYRSVTAPHPHYRYPHRMPSQFTFLRTLPPVVSLPTTFWDLPFGHYRTSLPPGPGHPFSGHYHTHWTPHFPPPPPRAHPGHSRTTTALPFPCPLTHLPPPPPEHRPSHFPFVGPDPPPQ